MAQQETKIPAAWDLIEKAPNSGYSEREACIEWNDIENIMIEFAKLHVQKALEAAGNDISEGPWEAMKTCIIESYPLENIK